PSSPHKPKLFSHKPLRQLRRSHPPPHRQPPSPPSPPELSSCSTLPMAAPIPAHTSAVTPPKKTLRSRSTTAFALCSPRPTLLSSRPAPPIPALSSLPISAPR